MENDTDMLMRLQVNQPTWQPNAYLFVRRRWFRRPDGQVFALPETEDWHIRRLLLSGWHEVAGPGGAGSVPPEETASDARDAEIAALRDELAWLRTLLTEQEGKEAGDGDTRGDAADSGQSAGTGRRPARPGSEL